ncbi:MAG: hypothetical protein R2702_11630 [Acidimicrobiales bacterium]
MGEPDGAGGSARDVTGRGSDVAFFGALGVLAALVFAPSLKTAFFADDFGYLALTRRPGWWHSGTVWDLSAQVVRPITILAVGVQQELFGLRPLRFHVVGLGLVLLGGVLGFVLAGRLGLGRFGARATAAVLVLHAANGWTVMWTASTSSLYVVLLSLAAAVVAAAVHQGRARRAAVAGLVVLALLARDVAIVLPALLVLVRMVVVDGPPRRRLRRAVLDTLGAWVAMVAFVGIRFAAAAFARAHPDPDRLVPVLDGGSFRRALPDSPRHLHDLFVLGASPVRMRMGPTGLAFPWWTVAIAVALWALVVVGAVLEARRGRWVAAAGVAWFAVAIVPPAFLQAEITYVNYVDLAVPGIALAVGALAERIAEPLGAPGRRGLAAAGLLVLALAAHHGAASVIRPRPDIISRAVEIELQVRADYPDPAPGSTIVVRDARPEDPLWTSNGDQIRLLYDDPTLVVVFEPPSG